MDCYKIIWKSSAKKELKKLPQRIIKNIILNIEKLPLIPRPIGSKKLMGTKHTYRQRVGDYRVIYSIEKDQLIIEIIRIGHRKDIYKNN